MHSRRDSRGRCRRRGNTSWQGGLLTLTPRYLFILDTTFVVKATVQCASSKLRLGLIIGCTIHLFIDSSRSTQTSNVLEPPSTSIVLRIAFIHLFTPSLRLLSYVRLFEVTLERDNGPLDREMLHESTIGHSPICSASVASR